ncbi:MAG: hypothetical protein FWD94_00530 [Treponema sp.]|nr:hypothetical protein [Treponema sp.]
MIIGEAAGSERIERLRKDIDDRDYVRAAIQRIALVLSDGLIERARKEGRHERQRKRGRG